MGEESELELAEIRQRLSVPNALFVIIQVLMTDFALYGCIMPLIATFFGGVIALQFGLGHKYELIFVISLSFTLVYGTFALLGESSYWKHLFAFSQFYGILLQIRDTLNTCMIAACSIGLISTIKSIVTEDKDMKKLNISEGALEVLLKMLCEYLHLDPSVLPYFGIKTPHAGTVFDPSFGENERYEHGAAYMLFWAVLTGCVAKLLYFNTLFTYMAAMNIFVSMKPNFDEDGDTESTADLKKRRRRLDNDFARYIRNSNRDD